MLDNGFVDLVEESVDLAFRLGGTLPPQAIGRHLIGSRIAICLEWLVRDLLDSGALVRVLVR